ncbi:unnamed protein product, partial [Didymodactylos carnosus]
ELLFVVQEKLLLKKKQLGLTIRLCSCVHIGTVNEILLHLEKQLKTDLWSEHITLINRLLNKTQPNHCLTTSTAYTPLKDLYLFRTAGTITNNDTTTFQIYYLLGRLIGDNIFQGRNTLPLNIGITPFTNTVQTSTSTDSGHSSHLPNGSSHPNNTKPATTSTSTSSSTDQQTPLVVLEKQIGEEQKLSQKHVRINSSLSSMVTNNFEQSSYINRSTLLRALIGCGSDANHQQTNMKVKKFCLRSNKSSSRSPSLNIESNNNNRHHGNTKHTPPPPFILHSSTTNSPIDSLEKLLPKMVHINDNCWSSHEDTQNINGKDMNMRIGYSGGEGDSGKCLILTQKMLTGSCQSDDICSKSTQSSQKSHHSKIPERKSFTEEDFRRLLVNKEPTKENSLSTTNEESSSFSWDESDKITKDKKQKFKHDKNYNVPVIMCENDQLLTEEKIKTPSPPSHIRPSLDCYFPRRPSDLSFTVNMSTTEDEQSIETKSTLISPVSHTHLKATSPSNTSITTMTGLTPKNISSTTTDVMVHPVQPNVAYYKKPNLSVLSSARTSRPKPTIIHYRNKPPRNLARKLIQETSDTSEISLLDSIDEKRIKPVNNKKSNETRALWKENCAYARPLSMINKGRVRLSSSHSNLLDLLQREDECSHDDSQYPTSPCETNELLQRWLQDQLNMFEYQIKQQPLPPAVIQNNSDSDDESDTVSENTFTQQKLPLFNSKPQPTRTDEQMYNNNNRPQRYNRTAHKQLLLSDTKKNIYNNVRYKSLKRSQLVRHESLKNRNRPLLLGSSVLSRQSSTSQHHHSKPSCNNNFTSYHRNGGSSDHILNHSYCDKDVFGTDSSMPRSDTSDFSQPQLSESVISNLESEYDNYQPQQQQMSNSQILSDDDNRSYL